MVACAGDTGHKMHANIGIRIVVIANETFSLCNIKPAHCVGVIRVVVIRVAKTDRANDEMRGV